MGVVVRMSEVVKRSYDSSRRKAAAVQRRTAALDAARRLFTAKGYASTTMADIAAEAGTAVDTLYAAIGTKPQIFGLLLESALSGTSEVVPIAERDYVARIRAEPDPHTKLAIYAESTTQIWGRMAALLDTLQRGAAAEPELAETWDRFILRRADNLGLLLDDLAKAGALPDGFDRDTAQDGIWAVSSTEVYVLLVTKRGWPAARYQTWLADTLRQLLLR